MSLLPVAEAQARLLALADPLLVENIPIDQAAGRWLARDLASLRDQPWADLSAMDGYAVRADEHPGPWTITGTSKAGDVAPSAISPGEACRIFTGAPLPAGADAILIQENAAVEGTMLSATDGAVQPGLFVRPKGSDFARDAILLKAGTLLGPAQIAMAILAGHGSAPVRRRARVAIVSSGDELVPPGNEVLPGSLPSSNGPMLASMLRRLPCEVMDMGIVPDELPATVAALRAASGADIIVTTGGASVGDHDLIRPALERAGGSLDFWKIRMRPGKPLMAGRLGDALFLGLPGNPVSAYVTATLFMLPVVRHLCGAADSLPHRRQACLSDPLPATGERDDYLRAVETATGVSCAPSQDSAATLSLAMANCLIVRPAGSPAAHAGQMVDILPI